MPTLEVIVGKPEKMPVEGRPLGVSSTPPWSRSHGMYIAGRAYADEADLTASQMEAKWGCDRLRLLVGPELREKFDRQRYLFNQALWHGDLEGVRRESQRMVKAWLALDKAADGLGATPLDLKVWEITLADGAVAAIVPDNLHAGAVFGDGRHMRVFTLDEIARLLSEFPALAAVKATFPGATVTKVSRDVPDSLNGIADTDAPLDELIPF